MRAGDVIPTPYGHAILRYYRELDCTYVLDLPFGGKLYANRETIRAAAADSQTKKKKNKEFIPMELNEAYESLEKMRLLNLELACQERGIPYCSETAAAASQCTTCLLASNEQPQQQEPPPPQYEELPLNARFPRIKRLVKKIQEQQKINNNAIQKGVPCLLCGSPVCATHASESFRKEGIDVCGPCEQLFGMDFCLDCLTMDKAGRRQQVDRMLDSYDRTLLLLKYSSQFLDCIAASLEENTVRQNTYIGVGGSSAGIVSGVLGIAAAASILTPAGPPLLIASLLFGGGATAVQTGAEVKQRYFSQPDKLADRIIALHAMLQAIVRIIGMLRDALMSDSFCRENYLQDESDKTNIIDTMSKAYQKNKGGILAGFTAGRLGMAGMEIGGQLTAAAEVGTLAGRNARFFSRSGSNLLRTARFARFAGGALAAATLVLEAKCMTRTIADIRAGNPCEKADALRRIRAQLDDFPSSSVLDAECERYLQAMNQRERRMTQEEAVRLLLETANAPSQDDEEEADVDDNDQGQVILESIPDDEDDATVATASTTATNLSHSTTATTNSTVNNKTDMSASLLERIERAKRQEGMATTSSSIGTAIPTSRKSAKRSTSAVSSSSSSSSSAAKPPATTTTTTSLPATNESLSASLLHRIEMFKKRQSSLSGAHGDDDDLGYSLPQSDCGTVPVNILG